MKNKSIVLLSGGLDSVVSLALVKEFCSEILAITFNYGQKSFLAEKEASEKISQYYNIEHIIVDLPWLNTISNSSLTNGSEVPKISMENLNDIKTLTNASNSVWIPNRNALFINIGACYAEAKEYNSIIIGANKEESATFKDNSDDFIKAINLSLENSLNNVVKVIAPLIDASKSEIVKMGLDLNIPFNLIYSCYLGNGKHCGECESCMHLKRALLENKAYNLIDEIF